MKGTKKLHECASLCSKAEKAIKTALDAIKTLRRIDKNFDFDASAVEGRLRRAAMHNATLAEEIELAIFDNDETSEINLPDDGESIELDGDALDRAAENAAQRFSIERGRDVYVSSDVC